MKSLIILMLCLLVAGISQAGVLTWTGGGDAMSTFQEANWNLDGGVAPAGTIDPSPAVLQHDILYAGEGLGYPGGANGGAELTIGDGQTLAVSAGIWRQAMPAFGAKGIRGVAGGSTSYIDITGGTLFSQFLDMDLTVTLGGDGILELAGGGGPLGDGTTTIDFIWRIQLPSATESNPVSLSG